jgi:hypothetical protein
MSEIKGFGELRRLGLTPPIPDRDPPSNKTLQTEIRILSNDRSKTYQGDELRAIAEEEEREAESKRLIDGQAAAFHDKQIGELNEKRIPEIVEDETKHFFAVRPGGQLVKGEDMRASCGEKVDRRRLGRAVFRGRLVLIEDERELRAFVRRELLQGGFTGARCSDPNCLGNFGEFRFVERV